MDRTRGFALVAYLVLLGSLATPLYEPLSVRGETPWAVLAVLGGAHIGLGLVVRRGWVLVLPAVFGVLAFVASGAEGLAWLILVLELPFLVAITAAAWLTGRNLQHAATGMGIAAFAAAGCTPVAAAIATAARGPDVSAALQARLPIELSLGNLCPNTQTAGPQRRMLRRSAELLITELRRRPDNLVTYTYFTEQDADGDRREITISSSPRTSYAT